MKEIITHINIADPKKSIENEIDLSLSKFYVDGQKDVMELEFRCNKKGETDCMLFLKLEVKCDDESGLNYIFYINSFTCFYNFEEVDNITINGETIEQLIDKL